MKYPTAYCLQLNANILAAVLDLASARMGSHLLALGAEFVVLELGGLLLVDAGGVVLHFALLAAEVNVGALSSWHKFRD